MQVGDLYLRLVARSRTAASERFSPAACYACLEHLAAALREHPWMVVSGLVEPLWTGTFRRRHSDIDIGIPVHALAQAVPAIVARGYALSRRLLRTHLSRRWDLEVHQLIDASRAGGARHLRLWRLGRDGRVDEQQFPPYVDLFPYQVSRGELHILENDWRCPLREPLIAMARLPSGAHVPVEHPEYVRARACI